jgi:hypothetical protein
VTPAGGVRRPGNPRPAAPGTRLGFPFAAESGNGDSLRLSLFAARFPIPANRENGELL